MLRRYRLYGPPGPRSYGISVVGGDLRENEKKLLRLVEFALVLFQPTGLEFAIGVFLSGFNLLRHGIACGARKRVLAYLSEGDVSVARASWSSQASSAAVGTNGSELEGTI
eukprot:scaffold11383_cov123-Isochrysis_galbana.AAC.5